MFEVYNDIMCVQGGWLYEAGIMSQSNYKKLKRLYFNVIRRGCNSRPALIEYDSLPDRFKQIIENEYGNPHITQKESVFKKYLEIDQKAKQYYDNYTLDNGQSLPERNIREYTANVSVLNAIELVVNNVTAQRLTLGGAKVKIWDKIVEVIQELPSHSYPHTLPTNQRRLRERLKNYKSRGYEILIHKNFCNKNSEKINEDAKLWLIARWADRVKKVSTFSRLFSEYNKMCDSEGWKKIKNPDTIKNYLHQEHVKNLWYGYRYGELKSKEKYTYFHTTQMSSMRDSLWYSDGTKLNFYYLDEQGNIQTCQVYEVMDTFSEVFLGYHISKTEDFEAQYYAYKMAVQISGHKPYELKYDGQGGHGKLHAGNFLSKLSKFATKTQPYNGKSKTIESAFGRFQQQIMAELWYFTGQNITSKRVESKANMEFILSNKKNLPSLDEVKEAYAKCREEWNNSEHHKTGESRIQMYLSSTNPETIEISMFDMIDMFWITREKPVTCTPYGISFKDKNKEYQYMVYDDESMPDFEWLANNIDKKFYIKYDPSDMGMVYLYIKDPLGLRRVGAATTKITIHRNRQEQEHWEQSWLSQVNEANKRARLNRVNEMEDILKSHNMSAEDYGLKSPKISGVKSTYDSRNKGNNTIGEYQKELSNTDSESEYVTTQSKY